MKPLLALAALGGALLSPVPALADTQLPFDKGEVVLPISGLALSVPRDAKRTFKLTASWALDDSTSFYDGRDVVDEFDRASGDLVRGNWIMTGYFSAGGCDSVLSAIEIANPWTDSLNKWSADWQLRGGDYDLGDSLGKHPVIAMCREDSAGHALLLYHFLVDTQPGATQKAALAQLPAKGVLSAASAAFDAHRNLNVYPTKLDYVRQRGETPAVRHIVLGKSPLEFDVPDDGQVWLLETSDATDLLTRMAPAIPDLAVELVAVPGSDCDFTMGQLESGLSDPDLTPAALRGVPAGWQVGPATKGEDPQHFMCAQVGDNVIVAGVYPGAGSTDIGDAAALLTAVTRGTIDADQ